MCSKNNRINAANSFQSYKFVRDLRKRGACQSRRKGQQQWYLEMTAPFKWPLTHGLSAHKDPRTRGGKPVCIPICKVRHGPDHPFQRIVGRYKPPSRGDYKQNLGTIYTTPTSSFSCHVSSSQSLVRVVVKRRLEAKKKRSTGVRITSSNMVRSPSFALYYSLISVLFSFCFFSTFT